MCTRLNLDEKVAKYNSDNIFFVSDLHFNHTKLCNGYDVHFDRTLKYSTIEEMNADIIKQWNDTVGENDIVIFLGDMFMGTPGSKLLENYRHYVSQLKFKKMYFLRGNHDYDIFKRLNKFPTWEDERVLRFPDDYITATYKGKNYFIQHYAIDKDPMFGIVDGLNKCINKGMNFDYIVHGHTHSDIKLSEIKDIDNYKIQNNVCWDAWYRPVNINELVTTRE